MKKASQLDNQSINYLVDASIDGILAFDGECRYTAWNRAMERISGLRSDQVLGRCAFDIFPFLKETGEDQYFYEALSGRCAVAEMRPYVLPDTGRKGFFDGHYSPLCNEKGEVIGGVAVIRDITARKKADDALRQIHAELEREVSQRTLELSTANVLLKEMIAERKQAYGALQRAEDNYRSIFENAIEGIYQSTPSGHFIAVNPAMARMFGFESPEEMIRERTDIGLQHYVNVEDRAKFERLIEERGVVRGFEIQAYRKDGRRIWTSESARVVRDVNGTVLHYEGTIEDITERKLFIEALSESEKRFRMLIRDLHVGVLLLGPHTEVLVANQAALDMLGFTEEQLIGKSSYDPGWNVIREDGTIFHVPEFPILQAINTRQRVRNVIMGVYRRAAQDWVWLQVDAHPRLAEDGTVIQVVCTFSDITDRQRAKEERIQLQQRLITAQEEERRRIARELHDQMGQQLTALMLELRAFRDSGQITPSQRERLQRLMGLADELGREVHTLAWELRPTALDDWGLHTALSNYVEEWSERSGVAADFHSNGLIEQRLPQHIEMTVYRVVQEALTNVLKHAQARRVSVLMEYRSHRLLVIVEDDGQGFDVEAVKKAALSEKRLGLLGMRERVTLAGGTLDVESTSGDGTTLYVRIPVVSKGKERIHG